LSIREIAVKSGATGQANPAVYVYIEDGEFRKADLDGFNVGINIYLTIKFKNLRNEKQRRHGIYPILQGILEALTLQDLGLEIEPLKPKAFGNITTDNQAVAGILVFQMAFETDYYLAKIEEESIIDLFKIGLGYYLQWPSDDGIKDSEDLITL